MSKKIVQRFSFFAFLLLFSLLQAAEVKSVKYVFLFIGDGMSIPQRMMTDEYLQRTEKRGLLINQLECQGLTRTSAANAFITDSAASGTAIACGEKTNNGRIGMDASGKNKLVSSAEVARDN
ncbi:MAG: alkaline phosphatase, partial [Lentisphaerae bacterium]|nr:alkaline phosphatase [Lentisphaerota bacterium]